MSTIFQFNKPQSRTQLLEKIEELKRENAKLTADKQDHDKLVRSMSKRIHDLENDLETAKQVAEYWKKQAEANQILASIYKMVSSI